MALGNILKGKNGLVKVGTAESNNIKSWSRGKTVSTTTVPLLNVTNDPQLAGSTEISGTLDILFDPADATHVAMEASGEAVLELYLDGDASGKSYFGGTAQFTDFQVTNDAGNGTVEASVSWVAVGENTLQTVT